MKETNSMRTGMLLRCCLCVGGAMGMVSNCMGIYFTPLSKSLGVTVGRISVIVTLVSLLNAFFAPAFVALNRKVRINLLMSFGVLCAIVSYLIMSVASNLYVLYGCGILSGVAMCCFAALPVSLVLRSWYGEKNGTALGTALAFSGVFGAFMNPLLSHVITAMGYRFALRLMALILAAVVLPCAFTMRLKDEIPASGSQAPQTKPAPAKITVPLPTLAILFATCMSFCFLCGLNQHFSAMAISLGNSLETSATVVTCSMLGNICFKLIYGYMCDRMNPIRVSIIWAIIGAVGTTIVLLFGTNPILLRVGAFFYASFFSLSTVALSMLTQRVTRDQYAAVYSRLTIFTSTTYAIAVSIFGSIYDAAGSYRPALMCVIAVAILASVLASLLMKKAPAAAV